jgi:hypothetical protein
MLKDPSILTTHSNGRVPVILSTRSAGAGPMPTQVAVPGSTCVSPRSWTIAEASPRSSAFFLSSSSSPSDVIFTTILHCPSLNHSFHHSGRLRRVSSAAVMLAWPTWTAIFPFPMSKSRLTAITSLYLKSVVDLTPAFILGVCPQISASRTLHGEGNE